jgi:UDP-N-acetylglucosamine acyltransferase
MSHLATLIHPTAVVSSGAKLALGVVVGPFTVIEDHVEIGRETTIGPHTVILAHSRIGARNRIHAHAVVGDLPQDVSFEDEETWVEVGNDNILREAVTIHRATGPDRPTSIGDRCFLMVNAHVGHDCRVGDDVVLSNDVNLGGHAEIGDGVIMGGAAGAHQFVRIGPRAMIGGYSAVLKDILPFSLANGNPARHYRLNAVGLRRSGITGTRYRMIEESFRRIRDGRTLDSVPETPETTVLREWLAASSKRGLTGFAASKRDKTELG